MPKKASAAIPKANKKKPYVPLHEQLGKKLDRDIAKGTAERRKKANRKKKG